MLRALLRGRVQVRQQGGRRSPQEDHQKLVPVSYTHLDVYKRQVVAPASSSTTTTPAVATSSTSLPAPAADPSGPKVISIAPGGERVLTKADAFSSEYWDEGSYQPVGQPAQQAMAFDARCRSSRYPVEFRFGQSSGTLTFTCLLYTSRCV